jgi:DNA-binding response OmpR family regulator
MTLESLLLSEDEDVVRVLQPTLEKLAIDVEICSEARTASEILLSEKFDAVIVDCDDLQGGREVLQGLRATASNKNSVAFAVLNGKKTTMQEAFGMGVNFVLQKPVSTVNALRCFYAALNFMERERRRYFRQPVKMLVRVVVEEKEIRATSTNVSEGGIALLLHQALPTNATPRVQFTLPGASPALDVETDIAWTDTSGHAGLRFRNLPQVSQLLLENWLTGQMEKHFPGATKKPAGQSSPASGSKLSR